ARQIVAMLLAECERGGVTVRLGTDIGEISHADGQFTLANATAPQLVIATGGASIPKMGATGRAYAIARQFGLKIVTPRPDLVPFTLGDQDQMFRDISGVSCPVLAGVGDQSFQEAALFTHKGLSGPAILQVSSYWLPGEKLSLCLISEGAAMLCDAKRRMPRSHIKAALAEHLPARLAQALATRIGIETELGNVPDRDLGEAAKNLTDLTFWPTGTEGFAKAEVTVGGISTAELSSKTMQARKVPGLYVIGEAVDVTGWLGGYNFQWAWASGVAAGLAIAERVG
ncbi:MAG: NAD(P)/FAD-dependent oxidoreductase, partial [Paracoccaceae bacterium]